MKTKMSDDRFIELAKEEVGCDVTAGGLFANVTAPQPQDETTASDDLGRDALAWLVQLQRRHLKLSLEALAQRAELDVAEVLSVERAIGVRPEPRVLSKLGRALELPPKRLLALSGWGAELDLPLASAAVKFAARSSAPTEPLSKEENDALAEFVRFLAHQADEASKR